MFNVRYLPILFVLLGTGAYPVAESAEPSADPDLKGWTAEGFVKSLNRAQQKPAAGVDSEPDNTAAEINKAARRSTQHTKPDAYLDALIDEANDVSIDEKPASKGAAAATTLAPAIERVVLEENLVEVGGRQIKGGYLVVQPGDTLSQISRDIYGDLQAYDRIFEANRNQLEDPDMLPAGISLFIPIE